MLRRYLLPLLLCLLLLSGRPAHALDYLFTDGPGLRSLALTAPSLYADIQRGIDNGAKMWTDTIANDTTLRITVEISDNIVSLAGAAPFGGFLPYSVLQERLPHRLPREVPAFATGAFLGSVDASSVWVPSAAMKALGVMDTPLRLEQSDGYVLLSTTNRWDADPSDGINGFDLSAVMAHEIAHASGIVSIANAVYANRPEDAGRVISPILYDLSRFSSAGVRSFAPGVPTYLSLDNGVTGQERPLAGGTGVGEPGAEHLNLAPSSVVMSWGFVSGVATQVQEPDLAAWEANGFTVRRQVNVGAPEPSPAALLLFLLLTLWAVRRRREDE